MANLPTTDLTITDVNNGIGEDTYKLSELCQSERVVADYIDPNYVSGDTPEERLNNLRSAGYKLGDFRNYGDLNMFEPNADVRWLSFSLPENALREMSNDTTNFNRPLFGYAIDVTNWKSYLFAFGFLQDFHGSY